MTSLQNNNQFTARQIAEAIGKKRQAVQRLLASLKPSGRMIVGGQAAKSWSIIALPAALQKSLSEEAARKGCRDAEHLLSTPGEAWKPSLPLAAYSQETIEQAGKLKTVLQGILGRKSAGEIASSETESLGLGNYEKEFDRRITARYLRKLIARTVARDGGKNDWGRLELYLPDRTARKSSTPGRKGERDEFAAISEYIGACALPATEIEKRGIWTLAFDEYARLVSSGVSGKGAARRLRTFLFARAPFLCASREALLKAFARKLDRWEKEGNGPKALIDRRGDNGAHFEMPESDRDALIHRAVFYYRGDMAPAWRDLLNNGFSEAVRARYLDKSKLSGKSYVPTSIRESIATEVELLTVIYQGPRAFDQIKGYVDRSYEEIASCKCMSADDFTMPVYFYAPDGKGWFDLTRGQILLFIDFRSLRILGWSLQPDRNYSSLTIRSLCTHVFSEHGVPSVLQFERGIWQSATLIKGQKAPTLGLTEVAQGLREFGIRFIHSIRARSKAVERVGGLLQDLMEAEPGYCGRDERRDAPENLRKQMAAVESRKADCLSAFYSFDEWEERFGEIVEQYNATAQEGKILKGLSPDAAFAKFDDPHDPPMDFSGNVRYLLAHDKRPARVTLNGVTIRVGKKPFNYRGKEIAHLVGREVLVWFDPENPEVATVTDMNRENPICVERSEEPSALECLVDPESGTLARELGRIEGQASHIRARFHAIKAKYPMPKRRTLAAAKTVELGEAIAAQRGKLDAQQNLKRKTNRLASDLGIKLPESAARRPETASVLARLAELLDEEES